MNEASWNELLGKIRGELSNLAEFIDTTKNNIESLETTVQMGSEKFPEASSQLTAVTGDLESAANNIMTIIEFLLDEHEKSCSLIEELEAWAEGLPDESGKEGLRIIGELKGKNTTSKDSMMDILASMSFHDLSGQKLKKVIGSLGAVEDKLLNLAEKFGFTLTATTGTGECAANGDIAPAGSRLEQDVVDKLLKELGT